MTDAENVLWRELKGRSFGMRFRRQEPMLAFILDFYAPSIQLAIEVDGPVHDRDVEYDRERDARLTEIGVRVLRFDNEEVIESLRSVLERVRNAVDDQSRVRDAILAKRERELADHRRPSPATSTGPPKGGIEGGPREVE